LRLVAARQKPIASFSTLATSSNINKEKNILSPKEGNPPALAGVQLLLHENVPDDGVFFR
jgi:hypothetical protein